MDETMKKVNEKALSLNEEILKRTKILEGQVSDQIVTTNDLSKFCSQTTNDLSKFFSKKTFIFTKNHLL